MATIYTNVLTATLLANGISVGFWALLSVLLLFLDPELGSFTSCRLRWDHVLSLVRGCIACDWFLVADRFELLLVHLVDILGTGILNCDYSTFLLLIGILRVPLLAHIVALSELVFHIEAFIKHWWLIYVYAMSDRSVINLAAALRVQGLPSCLLSRLDRAHLGDIGSCIRPRSRGKLGKGEQWSLALRAISTELHREYTFLQLPHLSDFISVLVYLRHHRLDLVDLRNCIWVQDHIVTLLDCSHDLGQCQLGRHELLQSFLCFIDFSDSLAFLVGLVERPCQLFLLLFAEIEDYLFLVVRLVTKHQLLHLEILVVIQCWTTLVYILHKLWCQVLEAKCHHIRVIVGEAERLTQLIRTQRGTRLFYTCVVLLAVNQGAPGEAESSIDSIVNCTTCSLWVRLLLLLAVIHW